MDPSQTISFADMFKNSFIAAHAQSGNLNLFTILMHLSVAFFIGTYIYWVYKNTYQGVLYQKTFNVTLVGLAVVTCLVIMTISGNLILSLGMVGALSIVRFRTPIKEPIDLVYIFWSIAVGIATGVGFYKISLTGSAALGAMLFMFSRRNDGETPYLLSVELLDVAKSGELEAQISKAVKKLKLRTKTITSGSTYLMYEVRLKGADSGFLKNLEEDFELRNLSMVSYSGEFSEV